MDTIVLVLHVLGATVWTGGHLVLCLTVLPRALAARSPAILTDFEGGFERLGIPALLVQVMTGAWLAYGMLPDLDPRSASGTWVLSVLGVKVVLLLLTFALAAHARLRLIPGLGPERLRRLAAHIIAVTVLSVLFVIAGVALRLGPAA